MAKSLYDKAFFVDKIEFATVLDVGCADGALGAFIGAIMPDVRYVGYDTSPEMVAKANLNLEGSPGRDSWATFDWAAARAAAGRRPVVAVANSVVHEVYHYGDSKTVDLFWSRLFDSGFEHVVVRDMVMPWYYSRASGGRRTDINLHTMSDSETVTAVRSRADRDMLAQFESLWGSIDFEVRLVHFLMKYRYADNWEREVRENYFPINAEDLKGIIRVRASAYEVEHFEQYSLKYNRDRIREDFGVEFDVPTHVKLILKMKTG